MAYVEIRGRDGEVVGRRRVEDGQAETGCRVHVDGVGDALLTPGASVSLGEYQVSLFTGWPSDGAGVPDGGCPGVSIAGSSAEAPPDPGERPDPPAIAGYEILGQLGQGGMGSVWRARDLSTQREVAIKFLRGYWFGSDKAKGRFEREVALAAKLTHPNIARVYTSGLHHGVYYYVMEIIDGASLDEYVRQNSLSAGEILRLVSQVCDAVQHAHSLGIIHRDLKPSNILVGKDGQPHIVDFGLARMASREDYDLILSVEGEVAGTPAYMAPEQAAGRGEQISERTDVYSLGAILYQLLTGHLPHEMKGGRYDVLKRIVEEEVRSPCEHNPAIDRELESLVLMALAKAPDQRYPSVAVLRQDIDHYLKGEALYAGGPGRVYRLRKSAARLVGSNARSLMLLAMAAVLVAATWYWAGGGRSGSEGTPGVEEVDWRRLADIPQSYEEMRGVFLGGKMYVVGGRTGHGNEHSCVTTVQAYDPVTNTWSSKAPLPAGRAAIGLVTLDGYLYAMGGITEAAWWGIPSDSVYRYDPRTDAWTTLAPMPIARSNFVAGVLGNKIYVAGGSIRWPKTTDRTDVYDPASGSWSTLAPMPAPRGSIVGGIWNGRLIVASGKSDAYTFDRRIFAYEVATGQWSQPASISARGFGSEAGFLYQEGDCMYFAGRKEGTSGTNENWIIRLAPLTGQIWFLSPVSPIPRVAAVAACAPGSHEIYVTGGFASPADSTPVTSTEKAVIRVEQPVPGSMRVPVMDQASGPPTGEGVLVNVGNGGHEVQQGVTAGLTGQLVRVELITASGSGTATLFVNKGSPWQAEGSTFATLVRATKAGWFSVDVSRGKLCFNKGDRFVISVVGTGADPWYLGTSQVGDAAEKMWCQVGVNPPAVQQEGLAFRTYVDECVPSPESK